MFQANGLNQYVGVEAETNPVSPSCGGYPERYNDRKSGCQYFFYDHYVINVENNQVVGIGNMLTFDWAELGEANSTREWFHHNGVWLYGGAGVINTNNGLFIWMSISSRGQAQVTERIPMDRWVYVRIGELFHGKARITSRTNDPGIDFSRQNSVIGSFSTVGGLAAYSHP